MFLGRLARRIRAKVILLAAVAAMAAGLVSIPSGDAIWMVTLSTALFGALRSGERPSPIFWLLSITGALVTVGFAARGLDGPPGAGDKIFVLPDIAAAREIAESRASRDTIQRVGNRTTKMTFDEIQRLIDVLRARSEVRIIAGPDGSQRNEVVEPATADPAPGDLGDADAGGGD